MKKAKRILVAPLNWGLGHASRCVPVISKLLELGCEVIIAADGQAQELLRQEFPNLEHVKLPGVKSNYSKFIPIPLLILLRAPRLFKSIKVEHEELLKLVKTHHIDGVISDNRYGLYHPKLPSVLIGHQLYVKTPFFEKKTQGLIQRLNSRFTTCWVPDFEDNANLSGDLSHAKVEQKNVSYVGPLSRFRNLEKPESKFVRKLIVVLSGPEPARTKFEKKLLNQLENLEYNVLLVRGKLDSIELKTTKSNLKIVPYLNSSQLEFEINQSELVLCRSGYSSIMDLAYLKKKVLFVPTPMQTEQEYLAKYLHETKRAMYVKESELNLEVDVDRAIKYQPIGIPNCSGLLESAIKDFLDKV